MNQRRLFRFVIDEPAQCALVAWAGDIDAKSLVESQREILADPLFEPGMRILHDCRKATFFAVEYLALGRLVPVARANETGRGAGRSAVVVSSTFDYGVMRQFFLLQEVPEEEQSDRQPFYEMDDACAWLDLRLEVLEHLPVVDWHETLERQVTPT